jgi:hypothetical protein
MTAPLALHIRRKGPPDIGAFIPSQPEPIQIFDNRVAKFWTATRLVQIFNPQNNLTTRLTRSLLRLPECARMTDVKVSGRRRRESSSVGNFKFQISDFKF